MYGSTLAIPRLISLLLLLTICSGVAWSAEPDAPPAPVPPQQAPRRPAGPRAMQPAPTGVLVKVTETSITVRPMAAAAKGATTAPLAAQGADAKPAPAPAGAVTQPAAAAAGDLTFVINQDTRVAIEAVMAQRMTNTGQPIRMLRYDRGERADLEPGQRLGVTSTNGVATLIAIMIDPDAPIRGPGTVVKIEGNSLTVTPGAVQGVNGRPNPAAPVPADVTYTTDPAQTRVVVTEVTSERVLPNGSVQRSISYRNAPLTELKEGQHVEVRARKSLAVDIRVVPEPPPGPAPRAAKPVAKPEAPKPEAAKPANPQ
jgi:hypothetical protein